MRTLSVAPGLTESWPDCDRALACRNTSPDPSDSSTKPKPFSLLNHLTLALISGPDAMTWEPPPPPPIGGRRPGGPLRSPKEGGGDDIKSSSKPPRRGERGLRSVLLLLNGLNPEV